MGRAIKTRTSRKAVNGKAKLDDIDSLVGYIQEGETVDIPDQFLNYVSLLYGESGSGKTSTLSKCPGAYIIQCDPKRRGLKVRQTNIPDASLKDQKSNPDRYTPWEVVEATIERILEDDSVQTVVIDNMRMFYSHATNHYCAKNMVNSLMEMEDFGASWDAVDEMYMQWFQKVADSGRGLLFICHQREREISLPDGKSVVQIQPDVTGRMFQSIRAITDFAFYLGFDSSGDRVLTVRHDGNDIWFKCCTDEDEPRFFDPNGNPVNRISAGKSPGECWSNILKSWDNELFDVDYVEVPKRKAKKRIRNKV